MDPLQENSSLEADTHSSGAWVPPINELPFDILRNLFLLLRHELKIKSTLMVVCRKWHWVITQIAHFWTTIKVEGWNGRIIQDRMDYTMKSIKYAQSMDLDIKWNVAFDHGTGRGEVSFIHPTIGGFIQSAPTTRWKSLSVCRYALIPEFMLCEGFPILEMFTIDTTLNSVPSDLLATLNDKTMAPKLKTLELDENWRSVRQRLYGAFERISKLKLGTPTGFGNNLQLPSNIVDLHLGSTYQILGQFPHVKYLSVSYPFWGNPEFPNVTKLELRTRPGPQQPLTFTFPKLETLEVINANPGNCLTNIIAPQLRHLYLPFYLGPAGTHGMIGMGLMAKLNPNTLLPSRVLDLLSEKEYVWEGDIAEFNLGIKHIWRYFPSLVSIEAKIWMSDGTGRTQDASHGDGLTDKGVTEDAVEGGEIQYWEEWSKHILKCRKGGPMEYVKTSWNDIREIVIFATGAK
jgi:hypothetical protein